MRAETEDRFRRLHSNIAELVGNKERSLGKISAEELGNFVSAFGNSEGKALLLLCLSREQNRVFTERNMESVLCSVQDIYPKWHSSYNDDQEGWAVSSAGPLGWCRNSLEPIGFVVREVVDKYHNSYGYCITDKGLEKGSVLAGLLLDFSYRHKISLTDLFGATSSPAEVTTILFEDGSKLEVKKRSPVTRLRIFWEIATAKLPLRTFDVMNAIGETNNALIGYTLSELKRLGIIKYSYRDPESYSLYRYASKPEQNSPIKYNKEDSITRDTYNILSQEPNRWFNVEDICAKLRQNFPKRANQTNLKISVYHALGQKLKRRKLIEVSEFNNFDHVMSSISLDEDQRGFLIELLTLLDGYANLDPEIWRQGRLYAEQFLQDSRKVRLLMKKAKSSSAHADKPSAAQLQSNLVNKAREFPGHTSSEIRDLVEEDGVKVALATVKRHLAKATKENLVSGVMTPYGIRWSVEDPH